MTENIEFLNSLHQLQHKATLADEFLQILIDNETTPTVLITSLAETQAVIRIQAHLIRLLAEEQLDVADNLEAYIEKHSGK